jgi:hypothetical protein
MNAQPKLLERSLPVSEMIDLPTRVDFQVERFEDGSERHTVTDPLLGTLTGDSREAVLAQLRALRHNR